MNAVQFPTIIRYLCRLRAHLKCFYFSNFNTRGADNVVVSAYDWLVGGPALMPRRTTPVIFGIIFLLTENDTVELCGWRCTAMRHTHTPS